MSNPTALPFVNTNATLSTTEQPVYKLNENKDRTTRINTSELPEFKIHMADRKPGSTRDKERDHGKFETEEGGKRRIARRSKRTKRRTTHKRKQKKTTKKSRRRHQKK